jgi:hypothetical protein
MEHQVADDLSATVCPCTYQPNALAWVSTTRSEVVQADRRVALQEFLLVLLMVDGCLAFVAFGTVQPVCAEPDGCAKDSAISGISFAPIANPTEQASEPWAQFCSAEACGVVDLSYSCFDMTNQKSTLELSQVGGKSFVCGVGEIVSAIYVSWDDVNGVHHIAGVQCKSAA